MINGRYECIEVRFVNDEIQVKLSSIFSWSVSVSPDQIFIFNVIFKSGLCLCYSVFMGMVLMTCFHFRLFSISTDLDISDVQTSYCSPTHKWHLIKNSELRLHQPKYSREFKEIKLWYVGDNFSYFFHKLSFGGDKNKKAGEWVDITSSQARKTFTTGNVTQVKKI